MRTSFSKAFKIASVYTGVILGAGFASGQEIYKFFVRYGFMGLVGLLISGFIFFIAGYAVMDICIFKKIDTYSGFMEKIMGKKAGRIMELMVIIFLMALFSTMLAAGGAAFEQAFGLPYSLGIILTALLCFITFLFDMKGVIDVNTALVPALVAGGIFIGLYSFYNNDFKISSYVSADTVDVFKSAFLYASYNIITAVTVLCTMRDVAEDKKSAGLGVALGGAAMTVLGVCMALPLYIYESSISHEIPLLHIAGKFGAGFEYLFLLILLAAILTSAVGNGFGIINFFQEKFSIKPLFLKISVTVIGIIFAHIGFSNFVGSVYPIFGYIGMIEIVCIIVYTVKK